MAFIKIADLTATTELVMFPKTYAKSDVVWQRDQVVIVQGKVGSGRGRMAGGDEVKVLVDSINIITHEDAEAFKPSGRNYRSSSSSNRSDSSRSQRLYIRLEDSQNQPALMTLKEKLDGYKGQTEVVLVTGPSEDKQIIRLPQAIDVNEESMKDLALIFGSTNVVVR